MTRYGSMFVSVLVVLELVTIIHGAQLANGGKIWALLTAGSSGYDNYGQQADVCHAYQILHENGIPDENIIVMMYDDIANNTKNPEPGVIINSPGGSDVYKGVVKDYTHTDVTVANFLKVLSGDEEGMKGIGSGRVIKSGPNDHIFVNYVDHGGKGMVVFPNGLLYATDLIKTLKEMAANKQFGKLVFYLESCYSGSMFDSLPNNINVYAVTSAPPNELAYFCCWDGKFQAWVGDDFSVKWMNAAEKGNLTQEKLQYQFEVVRNETKSSHVQQYGDLSIASLPVSDFLGSKSSVSRSLFSPQQTRAADTCDRVTSRDASLAALQRKRKAAKTPEEKRYYDLQIRKAMNKRKYFKRVVNDILLEITDNDEAEVEQIKEENYKLKSEDFDCYKKLVSTFSEKCLKVHKNPHALSKIHVFANVCGRKDINEDSVVKAITDVCSTHPKVEEDE